MRTDIGMVREHNEDSAHLDPKHQFFIVADGMGGHAAGEVASSMAVEEVRKALEDSRDLIVSFADKPNEARRKKLVSMLEDAVRNAHKQVYERGVRESDKHGMGTTLDVVVIAGPEAFVAHVGDSRTYLIREARAAQVTTDHTVAEVLVIEGKLSLEEAQLSPLRTILVNAIGVAADVGIEMAHVQLRQGDHLLLCSDGLHDYFAVEQELADCISTRSPADAILELVTQAKERGGHDNITGIVVRVVDCDTRPLQMEKTAQQLLAEEVTATLPLETAVAASVTKDGAARKHDGGDADDADDDPDDDPLDDAPTDEQPAVAHPFGGTAENGDRARDVTEDDNGESDVDRHASTGGNNPDNSVLTATEARESRLDPGIFDEPTLEHRRPPLDENGKDDNDDDTES